MSKIKIMLIRPTPDNRSENEKIKLSIIYIDRLFPIIPILDSFQLHIVIGDKSNQLTDEEKKDAFKLQGEMKELLIKIFRYAEIHPDFNLCLQLTDLGIKVRNVGGHIKYQELLAQKADKNEVVESLKNENLRLQNQVLKFQISIRDLEKDLKDAQFQLTVAQAHELKWKEVWVVVGFIAGTVGGFLLERLIHKIVN